MLPAELLKGCQNQQGSQIEGSFTEVLVNTHLEETVVPRRWPGGFGEKVVTHDVTLSKTAT